MALTSQQVRRNPTIGNRQPAVETLTEQSKQLAALGHKVTRATAGPLKTDVSNPFNIAA